jgi:hypothetical protein
MAVLRGLALRRLIVCCRNESGVFRTGDRSTQTYYHSNDRQAPLRVAWAATLWRQSRHLQAGIEKVTGNLGIFRTVPPPTH